MQARLAVDHGKQVFLISSLVSQYSWARSYLKRGAVEVSEPDEIVRLLKPPEVVAARSRQIHQDALALD
jgi:DNA processing protein